MAAIKRKILFIVTGSIAAEKAISAVKNIKKHGISVTVVCTKNALEFISKKELEKLTGNKVYAELYSSKGADDMDHINLSRNADLVLIAPATANFIAKIAKGFADDLASNIVLASDKPILVAPAMNVKMWENKQTEKNVKNLEENGINFIGPVSGDLACGEVGYGRMVEARDIERAVINFFERKKLFSGKKVLVTAGPTIEKIDPVRFISNFSSGKQGYAIAEVFAEMGADVTLVSGPTNLKKPAGVKFIKTESADEMFNAVSKNITKDIAIFTAAVADYKIKNISQQKIKKSSHNLNLELIKNIDILSSVAHSKKRPKIVVGFAAETDNLTINARKKLKDKNADMIVLNDVTKGVFGADENKVSFVTKNAVKNLEKISKRKVAEELALYIHKFLKGK